MQDDQKSTVISPQTQQVWQPNTSTPEAIIAPGTNVNSDEISWTASEFIAHVKSAGWYALLILAGVVTSAIAYLVTHDKVTTGTVIIVAIGFGVVAARKPRELTYRLDDRGITVENKLYPYERFRSFSVVQEEGIESIWFMPSQRFTPGLSIYFAPTDGEKIFGVLADFLPFEPKEQDLVDRLMHRIRF